MEIIALNYYNPKAIFCQGFYSVFYNLKVGDEVLIAFGEGSLKFRVLNLKETVRKDEAASLYEIIND